MKNIIRGNRSRIALYLEPFEKAPKGEIKIIKNKIGNVGV